MPGFRLESPMSNLPVTIVEPLGPHVLRSAGVPLEDLLWFTRQQSMRAQMKCLRTPRGERILVQVRKFMQQLNANQAVPMGV